MYCPVLSTLTAETSDRYFKRTVVFSSVLLKTFYAYDMLAELRFIERMRE